MKSLQSAARALGGIVQGRGRILCPGPGHSRNDRSLSVTFYPKAPDGFIVYSFANDDFRECRDYVKERLGISDDLNRSQTGNNPPQQRFRAQGHDQPITADQADRERYALAIWSQSVDPRGTLVEWYLQSRGLEQVLDDDVCNKVIRFNPALSLDGAKVGGMVCLFQDIRNFAPCGIHRTFINDDGDKIGRKMLGRAKGAAIMFDHFWPDLGGLHIGEGVESVLSARLMGMKPSWALGSAGAIADFPVLNAVEALTVFCETDDNGANEAAFKACAQRYLSAGREVVEITPKVVGDMNDLIKRGLRW